MTRASVFNKHNYQSEATDKVIAEGGSKFVAKVFLYVLIALAITAITTMAFAVILANVFISGTQAQFDALITSAVVLAILYIPLIIWIEVAVLKGGKGLRPAFLIYSIYMGLVLSPLIAMLEALDVAGFADVTGFSLMGAVGVAFALTCAVFALMALIAWTTKRNLSGLAVAGYGLLMGLGLTALVGLIFSLIFTQAVGIISAIISGGFFLFVILVTLGDLYNIRRIAARGEGSGNLAMVCAFSLYTDFVYIFIRILEFVIRIIAILGISKNR